MQIKQARNNKVQQTIDSSFSERLTGCQLIIPYFFCILSLSNPLAAQAAPSKSQPPAEQASGVQLAKILDSSGILQKGYRCSVALDNNVATVSSYQNLKSKNPDSDCKIDAVLLAKKVFDSRSGLARVKVKLLDPRGSGSAKSITVTVGDISAYSAGKITMQSLLSSLEIVREDQAASANNQSTTNKATASLSDTNIYRNAKLGLSIRYPSNWTKHESPDAPGEVSFGGFNKSGQMAELRLRMTDANPEVSAEQFGKKAIETMAASARSFKKLDETREIFGSHRNMSGWRELNSVEANGITEIQQHMFFPHNGKYCWIALICPGWNSQDARIFFNDLLSTIESP